MKQIGDLEKEILSTVKYFLFFDYSPTQEEIYTFLKKKTSKRHFMSILAKMEEESLIIRISNDQFPISKQISNFKFQIPNQIQNSKKRNSTFYLPSSASVISRYTLPEYSIDRVQSSKFTPVPEHSSIRGALNRSSIWFKGKVHSYHHKHTISRQKIQKILPYIHLLSLFPQVRLIGLSGSVAMLNANSDHDVDLFIITAKNRLFTARFIALILAQITGIRRGREDRRWKVEDRNIRKKNVSCNKDKVCLNLFFDEFHLAVPKFKQTEYVAHEILQMKPLVCHFAFKSGGIIPNIALFFNIIFKRRVNLDCRFESFEGINKSLKTERSGIQKYNMYLRFIDANKWVFDIFPNAKSVSCIKYKVSSIKNKNTTFLLLNTKYLILNTVVDKIESLLKTLQLQIIRKHQTNEIITNTQLWFHPEDFGEKMKFSGKL